VLLRLAYLGVTNALALLRLLPMTDYAKDAEILALRHQIAILERQKQLGYVKEYSVYAPSLHTSEDARWDYRIVIVRASQDAPPGQSEGEVARQLFPDQETFRREENRRWELTANHWDLPIHVVNLGAAE